MGADCGGSPCLASKALARQLRAVRQRGDHALRAYRLRGHHFQVVRRRGLLQAVLDGFGGQRLRVVLLRQL